MPELKVLQQRLATARREARVARGEAFVEQQRFQKLEASGRELARRFDPKKPEHVRAQRDLGAALEATREELAGARQRRERLTAALEKQYGVLAELDPRSLLAELDARFPILLLPVRLETRFVQGGNTASGRQLLVRVYPDDASIDGFEPDLSEAEVKNLRRYWCTVWNAGGDLERWRAAWRELVMAHGAGRGLYLLRGFQPLPGSDALPERTDAATVILVIPVAAPPSDLERPAIERYWIACFRSSSDEAGYPALVDELGAERAAEIRKTLVPYNRLERPVEGTSRQTVPVSVAFVALRGVEEAATKRQAWTRAPEARLLPERFVLFGESGEERISALGNPVRERLAVGPDPLAEGDERLARDGADVKVPEPLSWMSDFEAAERAGMAFRVDLSARQAEFGFDRLYVLGVRLGSDPETARKELEELLLHQFQSQTGFAFVPQGTPTNNSEQASSAWARVQEADELFEAIRGLHFQEDQFDANARGPFEKRDGLVFAEALGIDPAVLQQVPHAAGTDQAEAQAMNAALWPATLGYFMNTQLRPIFDDSVIEQARRYFIDSVSGRGRVPAVRIGRQPYGILPTAAFSRWQSPPSNPQRPRHDEAFLRRLYELFYVRLKPFWDAFGDSAPHVGQETSDAQRLLLDIVGLHASSVEFHLQVLDSLDRIWNTYRFHAARGVQLEAAIAAELRVGRELLRALGYTGDDPEILHKLFSYVEGPMSRAAIDDLPLSESEPLRECTPEHHNYLEWCRDRATRAFDDLRALRGFNPRQTPNALLFHLLRHALQLGYHDVALQLHVGAKLIPESDVVRAYREPSFIHVADVAAGAAQSLESSESRYRYLYARPSSITGSDNLSVADFIPSWLGRAGGKSALAEQLEAVSLLERVPTARLERCFAEHLDLCSYRFDAWLQSLVHERLAGMRAPVPGDVPGARLGLYLGAFGFVERLKPDTAPLEPVTLDGELAKIFQRRGEPPLRRDPENAGHLLAPSLNQAVTAAVLRNGYRVNATPGDPGAFAVDLSSARVRVALQFLEGVRNGQPLGALLGYQLERRLHDRHGEAEVDVFIYELRKAFPLAAKKIAESVDAAADSASIDSIEARNVCDGRRLLEHVRASSVKSYPWGKSLLRGTESQEAIINGEVTALFEVEDAIADLLLAESVHQVAVGNPERGAAALDAGSKGAFPPEPDVVRTPRSGIALTHRVALHLPADATAGASATPRAATEPALDAWIGDVLPPLADLVVRVRARNSSPGATDQVVDVDMAALGLSPIDALYVIDPQNEQGMTDFDDRVAWHVARSLGLCPDASIELHSTEPVPGRKTVFETAPLLASLRAVLLGARALRASDAALPNEAAPLSAETVSEAALDVARDKVSELSTAALDLLGLLTPLTGEAAPFSAVIDAADEVIERFASAQARASHLGVALSGLGKQRQAASDFFALVRKKARAVSAFWDGRSIEYQNRIDAADAPGAGEMAQREALVQAERAVSALYTPEPLPDVATLRSVVVGKRGLFGTVKAQIDAVAGSAATTLKQLWLAWEATAVPREAHDMSEVRFDEEQAIVRRMFSDTQQQLTALLEQLQKRLEAEGALRAQATAASGTQKVELLVQCAKALLGDGFRIIPRFVIGADQADEWQHAFDARAASMAHLATEHDFPLDDWLYGVARVRTKLHDLEKIIQVTNAFARSEPVLESIQLPFRDGEPWLGLELPPDFDPSKSTEHLIYTAIYPGGSFDRSAPAHAGLLLDEWTEVIPGKRETAGLAFHFDRPSNEAPQTWLLVTPASAAPNWNWDDLKLAVPETFDLARKRAAEPRDVARTPLARLLPATLMAFTASPITISSLLQAADIVFHVGATDG